MSRKSASQPAPAKSNISGDLSTASAMSTSISTSTPKRRKADARAAEDSTTTGSAAKKVKTGVAKPGEGEASSFMAVDSDDESVEVEADTYSFVGKKRHPLVKRDFNVGMVVAFLAHEGDSLGREVTELEKRLGRVPFKGDSYSANANWIAWELNPKNPKFPMFGKRALPAYVPLNENCHAIVVKVGLGWIPELDERWVKSWALEFDVEMDHKDGFEQVVKLLCGKPNRELKVLFTLIPDKEEGVRNMWELRMVGAVGLNLSVMQHGEKAALNLELSGAQVKVVITAKAGCTVCWDSLSTPGNRRLAPHCHFLKRANEERKKVGMDPIIIVDKMAVSTVGERSKLPLDARISQLEAENSTLKGQLKALTDRVNGLEKEPKGSGGDFKARCKGKVTFKQD